jgi:glycolate oxidase iron-sulfur subunit
MKIHQEPRNLLRSMPGIDLIEMKQPNRCCGMGGSFNLVYYDLSRKILQHKLDDIASTRADAVVTSCMGCMIQLKDGLRQRKVNTKVLHLMEVLEKTSD